MDKNDPSAAGTVQVLNDCTVPAAQSAAQVNMPNVLRLIFTALKITGEILSLLNSLLLGDKNMAV